MPNKLARSTSTKPVSSGQLTTRSDGSTNTISSSIYDEVPTSNDYTFQNFYPPLHLTTSNGNDSSRFGCKGSGLSFRFGLVFYLLHIMPTGVWVLARSSNCDDSSQIVFGVWVMHAWTVGWSLGICTPL